MLYVFESKLQRNFKSEFRELIDSGTENVPLFFVYHQNVPLAIYEWYTKCSVFRQIYKNVPPFLSCTTKMYHLGGTSNPLPINTFRGFTEKMYHLQFLSGTRNPLPTKGFIKMYHMYHQILN